MDTHLHRVFVEVTGPNDPLIPLRMADCVHNMRQALDHLAYRLAVSVHGTDPPPNYDNTGFPITTTPSHFQGAVYSKIGPKKRMPTALYADLEALQPYTGRDQRLFVLHELDNIDKHRFPPVVAGVASGQQFRIGTFSGSSFRGPRLGALKANTPVIEYIPTPNTEMDMELDFAGAIALDESSPVAPGEFVLPLLSTTRMLLLEIFRTFEVHL